MKISTIKNDTLLSLIEREIPMCQNTEETEEVKPQGISDPIQTLRTGQDFNVHLGSSEHKRGPAQGEEPGMKLPIKPGILEPCLMYERDQKHFAQQPRRLEGRWLP